VELTGEAVAERLNALEVGDGVDDGHDRSGSANLLLPHCTAAMLG
jgi:hypothetical protein